MDVGMEELSAHPSAPEGDSEPMHVSRLSQLDTLMVPQLPESPASTAALGTNTQSSKQSTRESVIFGNH